MDERRELEFASHPANLSLVRDFVRAFLEAVDIPVAEKELMVLGLDEACTNVIRHAYDHAPDRPMSLVCERSAEVVAFRLRDFGAQCDPARLQGRPLDCVQPGGLGLHLMRRAFTEIDYCLMEAGTELRLVKRKGVEPGERTSTAP
jgi:anti-sigma regulatory factor (Ser/Thr protein kinase)